MKKLGKLSISPDKIMKNEELINLQGGYQGYCCWCTNGPTSFGFMLAADSSNCSSLCNEAYDHIAPGTYGEWWC